MKNSGSPRLADVAREAGVSPALASLALRGLDGPSDASRSAVLRAAKKLDYRYNSAASTLAKQRTRILGVLLDLTQSFHVEAVDYVYHQAEATSYEVILGAVTPTRPIFKALAPLLSGSCEGILIIGMDPPQDDFLATLHIPVTVLGNPSPTSICNIVRTAGNNGVTQAVDHLAALGHKRIAYIDGTDHLGSIDRRRGYCEGMENNGLTRESRVVQGGTDEADGSAATRELMLSYGDVTAIICYNDLCAMGAIMTLQEFGLSVPEDVSVVGYDDSPVARTQYVQMTTIAQRTAELATLAVDTLIDSIENLKHEPQEIVLAPQLIVRATSGPVRKAQ